MDLKKEFATDESLEEEGVWQDFGDDLKCKIARMGNKNYQKEFQKLSKPYKKQIRRGTLNDAKAEEILIKTMAKAILLGWEGLEEDGNPVPYSEKNAIHILTEYKDFRDLIGDYADDLEAYKIEEDEEAEKN